MIYIYKKETSGNEGAKDIETLGFKHRLYINGDFLAGDTLTPPLIEVHSDFFDGWRRGGDIYWIGKLAIAVNLPL